MSFYAGLRWTARECTKSPAFVIVLSNLFLYVDVLNLTSFSSFVLISLYINFFLPILLFVVFYKFYFIFIFSLLFSTFLVRESYFLKCCIIFCYIYCLYTDIFLILLLPFLLIFNLILVLLFILLFLLILPLYGRVLYSDTLSNNFTHVHQRCSLGEAEMMWNLCSLVQVVSI